MLAAVCEPPVTHDAGYIYNRGGLGVAIILYICGAFNSFAHCARARFRVSGKRG